MDEVNDRGEPITDDTLLVVLNAQPEAIRFVLPDAHPGSRWEVVLDTSAPVPAASPRWADVGDGVAVDGRSVVLLRAGEGPR
jgi:glycogen operon protein